MSTLRLPVELPGAPGDELVVRGEAARYLVKVRRLEVGDVLVAFDPERAIELDARVIAVGRDTATLALGAPRPPAVVPRRAVTLIQSVGKGDKLDAVVRDATELGATRLAPAIAERSVARRDGPAAHDRLRRIAVEAARQCGRGDVPRVDPARELAEVVTSVDAAIRIALVPDAACGLGAILRDAPAGASFAFAVGPEGGFSASDRAALAAAGFAEVGLGPIVLRTETVCAAVLGAILVAGR